MNFDALKIILKVHNKKNLKRSRPDTQTRQSTSGLVHISKIKDKPLQKSMRK